MDSLTPTQGLTGKICDIFKNNFFLQNIFGGYFSLEERMSCFVIPDYKIYDLFFKTDNVYDRSLVSTSLVILGKANMQYTVTVFSFTSQNEAGN